MNNSSGILLMDKPIGPSSNQVVSMVKKRIDCKVGHTGTLDPLASGLLVLLTGESTRISQHLILADKKYETTIILGIETDTLDSEGKIITRNPVPDIQINQLDQQLEQLRGEITQTPPMYSALKHKGVPLYKLAREGKNIQRKPRQINIYSLEIINYEAPALKLKVHCSKGTYIRQLASDLGRILKTGAHVKALRRTSCGNFNLEQAVTLLIIIKISSVLQITPMEFFIQKNFLLPTLKIILTKISPRQESNYGNVSFQKKRNYRKIQNSRKRHRFTRGPDCSAY
jgi:tRNA pseudouridine55 synthase